MELKVTTWPETTPPTEDELREFLESQQKQVYRWSNDPKDSYEAHTHDYHKVLYVVKGSIKFDLPTKQQLLTLNTGDRLDLPPGIRHSAIVGEDGVICLEAHI